MEGRSPDFKAPLSSRRIGTWDVKEFTIRVAQEEAPPAILKCEIELLNRRRQFHRAFDLIYCREFFEFWRRSQEDWPFVGMHARGWLMDFLVEHRQQQDLSTAMTRTKALIYF